MAIIDQDPTSSPIVPMDQSQYDPDLAYIEMNLPDDPYVALLVCQLAKPVFDAMKAHLSGTLGQQTCSSSDPIFTCMQVTPEKFFAQVLVARIKNKPELIDTIRAQLLESVTSAVDSDYSDATQLILDTLESFKKDEELPPSVRVFQYYVTKTLKQDRKALELRTAIAPDVTGDRDSSLAKDLINIDNGTYQLDLGKIAEIRNCLLGLDAPPTRVQTRVSTPLEAEPMDCQATFEVPQKSYNPNDDVRGRIKAHDWEGALDVAKKIPDEHLRSSFIWDIVEGQIEASDWKGAWDAAQQITETYLRSVAFLSFVQGKSKANDWQCALDVAKKIPDKHLRDLAFGDIVRCKLQARDLKGAWDAAQQITDEDLKGTAIRDIVLNRILASDWNGALDAAKQIPEEHLRGLAFRDIVEGKLHVNDRDGALSVAQQITDEQLRSVTCLEIAEAKIEASEWKGAWEAAQQITDEHLRSVAFLHFVQARGKANDWKGALDAAQQIPEEHLKGLAFRDIVEGKLHVNDRDGALSVAQQITDERHKNYALKLCEQHFSGSFI
jgi:hypothetical protein